MLDIKYSEYMSYINDGDKNVAYHYINTPVFVSESLPKNAIYMLGREGVRVKIYKHKGKIRISTATCVDVSNQEVIRGVTYLQLYNMLVDDIKDLFGPEVNSPYVHEFILCHRDMLLASKVNMINTVGHAYYYGYEKMYDMDVEVKVPPLLKVDYVPYDIAQTYLVNGYYLNVKVDNPLLRPGEFVMVHDGKRWTRYESPSYAWRCKIRDKESDVYYTFFKHLTITLRARAEADSNKKKNSKFVDEYNALFPTIPYVEPMSIESHVRSEGYIIVWPQQLNTSTIRYIYNTWACYLLAVPLHLQIEVASYYNQYFNITTTCSRSLYNIWKKGINVNLLTPENERQRIGIRRVDNIIKQAGTHINGDIDVAIRNNIKGLVEREWGNTLYCIHRFLTDFNLAC